MPKLSEMREIVDDLSVMRHELFKILRWGAQNSTEFQGRGAEEREATTRLDEADVISSKIVNHDLHTVMLDLDVPARLVPSTTPGHSHLYIDVPMPWHKYQALLGALSMAGIIEPGYYAVSVRKRASMLRLPWIKKEVANADSDA